MARYQDPRDQFARIAADLRARIMSGNYAPGEQLPSTQQLVDHYGAANPTIQRALRQLKDEGFVYSRVGKGVYVRDRQPFVVDVGTYLEPSPKGYSYDLLGVAEVQPPGEVAEAFDLPMDDVAIMRHRLMRHDETPVEVSWSYYPADLARGTDLAAHRKIRGGAPRVLAELGEPQAEFVDCLSSRMPTTEELEVLLLPVQVPVLRQFRIIYSRSGRPVEASVLVKGAHLYELKYRQRVQ